jgi:hypothetical protein
MKIGIIMLLLIVGVGANPSEFRRDSDEFHHGTYDRIWKHHSAYIDQDGSIYLPVGEDLQKIDLKTFAALIKKLELGKAVTNYKMYIHPDTPWKHLQITLAGVSTSKLKFTWKVAILKPKTAKD